MYRYCPGFKPRSKPVGLASPVLFPTQQGLAITEPGSKNYLKVMKVPSSHEYVGTHLRTMDPSVALMSLDL